MSMNASDKLVERYRLWQDALSRYGDTDVAGVFPDPKTRPPRLIAGVFDDPRE